MESKVEKLAQARKKLLNYQKKQQKSRTETSSPMSSISNTDPNNSRPASSQQSVPSFNHDEKRSPFEWLHQPPQERVSFESPEVKSQDGPTVPPEIATNEENENMTFIGDNESTSGGLQKSFDDCNGVNSALAEAVREKEKLSKQLIELHRHYSEIYTAYNALANTVQNGGTGDSETQTQLSQLRTAMSVIVEEKTTLQQQLREANEVAKKRLEDIGLLNSAIHDKGLYIGKLERELNDLKVEQDRSATTLQRQKEELENGRRELISLQANILHVQQDRSDAQERLKLSLKLNEQLQAELDEVRKQLRMKDLYIRQLGAYSTSVTVNEQDVKSLHNENERLNAELLKAHADVNQYRKEAMAAREHYEAYGGQLNQKVVALSNQLEEVSKEKMLLEDKLVTMEEKVRTYERHLEVKVPDAVTSGESMDDKVVTSAESSFNEGDARINSLSDELNCVKKKLMETEDSLSGRVQRCSLLESTLADKTEELQKLKKDLTRVQTQLEEQQRASQDFCRLSSELQNEKATLSRAIAQNRELKDQLAELQDKMISLSTENMECESDRLTAVHTIEQLKAELMMLKGLNPSSSPQPPNVSTVTEEVTNNNLTLKKSSDETGEPVDEMKLEDCSQSDDSVTATHDPKPNAVVDEEFVAQLNSELEILRNENRRISRENAELRRIMEQNAEDENQNSIHVELGQAVERISTLSTENEELRNLNEQLQKVVGDGLAEQETSVGKDDSFRTAAVNTDQVEEDRKLQGSSSPPSLLEVPLAWTELEARFAKAMRQNAELTEQNELLEHIILQLQSENDTIGEYVTIYHHQRKVIQDRVRAKEEAVARLSLEKEQVKQKLNDLEAAVSRLFSSREASGRIVQKLNGTAVIPEAFSSNRSEEVTGSGDNNFEAINHLDHAAVTPEEAINSSSSSSIQSETSSSKLLDTASKEPHNSPGNEVLEEEILRLINELQDIEQVRGHTQCCAVNICCKECRGKLITL